MSRVQIIVFAALGLVCLSLSSPVLARSHRQMPKWRVYHGAWFALLYPADFTARGSIVSTSSDLGHDSAFFTSPDGSVQFYVYAPQWNGTPNDYLLRPKREGSVSYATRNVRMGETDVMSNGKIVGAAPLNNIVVRWATVKAKDGRYWRSWEDQEDKARGTRLVTGIRYKNAADLARYKAEYLRFKGSVEQFAD